MSLVCSLTVKPLLYACAALVLLSAGLGVALTVQHYRAASTQSELEKQASEWRVDAGACHAQISQAKAANDGYVATVAQLQTALKEAQDQAATIQQQSTQAIAEADAAAADADKTLKAFMGKYAAQVKQTSCAQALQHVEAVCPALRDY